MIFIVWFQEQHINFMVSPHPRREMVAGSDQWDLGVHQELPCTSSYQAWANIHPGYVARSPTRIQASTLWRWPTWSSISRCLRRTHGWVQRGRGTGLSIRLILMPRSKSRSGRFTSKVPFGTMTHWPCIIYNTPRPVLSMKHIPSRSPNYAHDLLHCNC